MHSITAKSRIKEKVLRKRKNIYTLKLFKKIMALKVKAVERLLKFDKESAGKYRYVMKPEMYSSLTHGPELNVEH